VAEASFSRVKRWREHPAPDGIENVSKDAGDALFTQTNANIPVCGREER